jgi:glyoxylase-like metal-dependent hydrolase (beta-lactamase superfamily II)
MTTHGSRRVGEVEVVALCDGITRSSHPVEESFPGVGDWDTLREAYPDVFTDDGSRWRFHVHAFLVRSDALTLLVDAGVGPPGTPWPEWAGEGCGRLPNELAAAGVAAEDVDAVVLTHVHDDHLGGFIHADGGIAFPNARHLMQRADFDVLREDPEDEVYLEHVLRPLQAAGRLEFVEDGHRIADGLTLLSTPGHTPGHQSLVIETAGETALIAGDVLNHPGQVGDRFPSGSDHDPGRAADTRERVLSRAEREGLLLSTAHLTEPFGRVELEGGRRIWRPLV